MNKNELHMVTLLEELKKKYCVRGIKLEFEAEGTRLEEAIRLKHITDLAGLELNIKIGGCEAIRDMFDAEMLGASRIIAPMVESPYAFTKFIDSAKKVYGNHTSNIDLLVNIETQAAVNCFDQMLETQDISYLSGIVIGRVDLSSSMNIPRSEIDGTQILTMAKAVAAKAFRKGLDVVIGGGVSARSMPFFKAFPQEHITRFETRKIIFSCPEALLNPMKAFELASQFELLWLENKKDHYGRVSNEDKNRLAMLRSRINSCYTAKTDTVA